MSLRPSARPIVTALGGVRVLVERIDLTQHSTKSLDDQNLSRWDLARVLVKAICTGRPKLV